MTKTLDRMLWARVVGGTDATIFAALAVGERFRFPGTFTVYTKRKRGWYAGPMTLRKYRTGGATAVIAVTEPT